MAYLKDGTKVQISNDCTNYKKKHNGQIGTVERNDNRPDDIITVRLNYPNPKSQWGLWYINIEYLDVIHQEDAQENNNLINECEGRKMRMIGILDLWKNRYNEQLIKNQNIEIQKAKEEDFLYKELRKKTDEINQMFPTGESPFQNWIDCQGDDVMNALDNETRLKLNSIRASYCAMDASNRQKYNEIKTMLSACDTYEQEIGVLKAYGILNESGILIKDTLYDVAKPTEK